MRFIPVRALTCSAGALRQAMPGAAAAGSRRSSGVMEMVMMVSFGGAMRRSG
jgi:hypothetical protein